MRSVNHVNRRKKMLWYALQRKRRNQVDVVKQEEQERAEALTYEQSFITIEPKEKMNKLYLVLALLFALSACSVGKKCTYTQDGTKLSSYVWFFKAINPLT